MASFTALFDRLMNEDAPAPRRCPDWLHIATELPHAPVVAPADASETIVSEAIVSSYISSVDAEPTAETLTSEMMVARLLQITDDLTIRDLTRLRRRFSWLNHPDRRGTNLRTQYTQLMVAANSLIDAEIAKRMSNLGTSADKS